MLFVIKYYKIVYIEKLRIYMYIVKNFLLNLKKDNKFRKVWILYVLYFFFFKLWVKFVSFIFWFFYRLNYLIFIDYSSNV